MIHKHNIDLSDLSYSGISNQIQGDERIAAEMLDSCAHELLIIRNKIEAYQQTLAELLMTERMLLEAGHLVAKHVKKQLPMAVITDKYIVVVTEKDLTIEQNVLVALD